MRRFEFVGGNSSKFWEAEVSGSTFVIVFGRIGTGGQRKEKEFPSPEAAQKELDKKTAEKLREGYQEVGAAAPVAAAPPPPAAPKEPELPALPPRRKPRKANPARLAAAVSALEALRAALPEARRSWALRQHARRARRALGALAGLNPYEAKGAKALAAALDDVLTQAPKALPLPVALELLAELDVAATERALAGPLGKLPLLASIHSSLQSAEVTLRLGSLLVLRPGEGYASARSREQRWQELAPHLQGLLLRRGATLAAFLQGLHPHEDPRLAAQLQRLSAAS